MSNSSFSRRKFLGAGLLTTAGLGLIPNLGFAASANPLFNVANERVRLGFIGVGRQAMGLLNNFMRIPGVEVVAGADVYAIKRERFALRVQKNMTEAGKAYVAPKLYEDYRELLSNPEVDAVVIATLITGMHHGNRRLQSQKGYLSGKTAHLHHQRGAGVGQGSSGQWNCARSGKYAARRCQFPDSSHACTKRPTGKNLPSPRPCRRQSTPKTI